MAARLAAGLAWRSVSRTLATASSSAAPQESFASLLAKSPIIAQGALYEGRNLEGIIESQDAEHLFVNVGLKFPVVMKRTDVAIPQSLLVEGTRMIVRLKTSELTAHFQGESKHTSMYRAVGEFMRLVYKPLQATAESDAETTADADAFADCSAVVPLSLAEPPPLLPSLTGLSLANNGFTELPANYFENSTALVTLDLSGMQLTSLPPGIFSPLVNLRNLSLGYNQLASGNVYPYYPLVGLFTSLENLEFLNLDSLLAADEIFAQIMGTEFATNRHLASLSMQSWTSYAMSSFPPMLFQNLSRLQSLDFSSTEFQLTAPLLRPLVSLTSLSTAGPIAAGALATLAALEVLTVQEATSMPDLRGLRSLRELTFVGGDSFSGPLLSAPLVDQAALVTIGLQAPGASLDLHMLDPCLSLQSIYLTGLNITTTAANPFPTSTLSSLVSLSIDPGSNPPVDLFSIRASNLPSLQAWTMPNVHAGRYVPGFLARNTALSYLFWGAIAPSAISLDLLQDLSSLQTLDVSGPLSSPLSSTTLMRNRGLTTLTIHGNLTTLRQEYFWNNTALATIDLSFNQISALPAGVFTGLPLTYLDLSFNRLTTLPAFPLPPTLATLTLEQNPIVALPAEAFVNLSALQTLTLSSTNLTSLPAGLFQDMSSLAHLDLSSNAGLVRLGSDVFAGLRHSRFRQLILRDCSLTSLEPAQFWGLGGLIDPVSVSAATDGSQQAAGVFLDLRNNQLTTISPSTLPLLGYQMDLIMDGNPSTCSYASAALWALGRLNCSCKPGYTGNGHYCEDMAVAGCLSGQSLIDDACVECPAGTYTAIGHTGPCPPCAAGTIDDDHNPTTPCIPCTQAGLYVPPGAAGMCANYTCAVETIDADNSAATPCVDICAGCQCAGLLLNCSWRGLRAIPPIPRHFLGLDLSHNAITLLPANAFVTAPNLMSVNLDSNAVVTIEPAAFTGWANATITMLSNPSSCGNEVAGVGCICAVGYGHEDSRACVALPASPCPAGRIGFREGAVTSCLYCNGSGWYVPPGVYGVCQEFYCLASTTDTDSDPSTPCDSCNPGTYVPLGSSGPCSSHVCPPGTSDVDANPASRCRTCAPGEYAPAGSVGACEYFICPIGTSDVDASPATPCVQCPPGSHPLPGSIGNCSRYLCPAGTTDADYNPASSCDPLGPGHYTPPGSAGPAALFECLPGSADVDYIAATPCIECQMTNVFVPRGSAGPCELYRCKSGYISPNATVECYPEPPTPLNTGLFYLFLLLLPVLVGAVFYYVKVERRRRKHLKTIVALNDELLRVTRGRKPRFLPRKQIRLDQHDVLGQGHFGEVVHGYYFDAETKVPRIVAVKMFKPRAERTHFDVQSEPRDTVYGPDSIVRPTEAENREYLSEPFFLKMFSDLASGEEINIVRLIGVVNENSPPQPLLIVTELCGRGNLLEYLRKRSQMDRAPIFQLDRLRIAYGIASGMELVHEHNVIHRDLAARNILITDDVVAKVADFGHAAALPIDHTSDSDVHFAPRWMAPEAYQTWTKACDIWSFGVVLWEIWTDCRVPYDDLDFDQVIPAVKHGRRLDFHAEDPPCTKTIMELITNCWKSPHQRPSFKELKEQLGLVLTCMQEDEQAVHDSTPAPTPAPQLQHYNRIGGEFERPGVIPLRVHDGRSATDPPVARAVDRLVDRGVDRLVDRTANQHPSDSSDSEDSEYGPGLEGRPLLAHARPARGLGSYVRSPPQMVPLTATNVAAVASVAAPRNDMAAMQTLQHNMSPQALPLPGNTSHAQATPLHQNNMLAMRAQTYATDMMAPLTPTPHFLLGDMPAGRVRSESHSDSSTASGHTVSKLVIPEYYSNLDGHRRQPADVIQLQTLPGRDLLSG
uniref:Receptor-type protein tyrosine kinase n=1 Tax=Monosiga ovata TaxID=81526 RepID=B3XVW8_9EUKA|nr:receptor-type protein tyrosine kinase [Monosiga ovata]